MIPDNLIPFADTFVLPGGTTIRRGSAYVRTTSKYVEGWVIDVGGKQYLYDDNVIQDPPTIRSLKKFGYNFEEQVQDSEWQEYIELEEQYSLSMIMSLEKASEIIVKYGFPLRVPVIGEEVSVIIYNNDKISRGECVVKDQIKAVVLDNDIENGRYVRVEFLENGPYLLMSKGTVKTVPLNWIRLS